MSLAPIIKSANADGFDPDMVCELVGGKVRRNTAFRLIEWYEHMKCYPSKVQDCDRRLLEAVEADEDAIREMAGLPNDA